MFDLLDIPIKSRLRHQAINSFAMNQSAGVVEYTDCISAEG